MTLDPFEPGTGAPKEQRGGPKVQDGTLQGPVPPREPSSWGDPNPNVVDPEARPRTRPEPPRPPAPDEPPIGDPVTVDPGARPPNRPGPPAPPRPEPPPPPPGPPIGPSDPIGQPIMTDKWGRPVVAGAMRTGRRRNLARLSEPDLTAFYNAHRYTYALGGTDTQTENVKTFEASGDHLYIAQTRGAMPVYVRLGSARNPFIRVRQGMTIRRAFERVTMRCAMPLNVSWGGGTMYGDVLFYSSFGRLVVEVPKEYGVRSRPLVATVTCDTGTQTLGSLLGLSQAISFGRDGGSLLIVNRSTVQSIYFMPAGAHGFTGSAATRFELLPGSSLELRMEANADESPEGWTFFTLAGTAQMGVIASSVEVDEGAARFGIISNPSLF